MNLHQFDLNLLLVLDAIYSEGSLSRAAERLYLSQPAVSHALARLRRQLNDPLFVRQGGQMMPTAFTRNLILPVRSALASLSSSLRLDSSFEPQHSQRQLTVGLRDVFEALLLPPLQKILSAQAPHMQLISVQPNRAEIESDLVQGKLDLALDIAMPVNADIRQQRIAHEPLVVMARADHPLTNKIGEGISEGLDLSAYLAAQHILVSARRKGGGAEDFALQRLGHTRRIALRCQHYFAAARVVSQSDWLLTMPQQYAQLISERLGTRCWPLPFDVPALDVCLYWHANAEDDAANRWLREQLMACFPMACFPTQPPPAKKRTR